jgi:hypothetical protein
MIKQMSKHNERSARRERFRRLPDVQAFVAALCDDAGDEHVVIGPTVWQPSDGTVVKRFYFAVATAGPDGAFRYDRLTSLSPEQSDDFRRAVVQMLVQHYRDRPRVIHDIGDELAMARLCEALWLGERITRLREELEVELAVRRSAIIGS